MNVSEDSYSKMLYCNFLVKCQEIDVFKNSISAYQTFLVFLNRKRLN